MPKITDLHLRIPEDLAEQLRECAKESDRTLNAEIIRRLRQTLNAYRV